MAGPPEFNYEDESGLVVNVSAHAPPFRELNNCWDSVGYFKVHRYHVTDAADIIVKPISADRAKRAQRTERAAIRLRDADIVLRAEPFVRVVAEAVAQLQQQRRGTQDA